MKKHLVILVSLLSLNTLIAKTDMLVDENYSSWIAAPSSSRYEYVQGACFSTGKEQFKLSTISWSGCCLDYDWNYIPQDNIQDNFKITLYKVKGVMSIVPITTLHPKKERAYYTSWYNIYTTRIKEVVLEKNTDYLITIENNPSPDYIWCWCYYGRDLTDAISSYIYSSKSSMWIGYSTMIMTLGLSGDAVKNKK